jgi:hypothetical protein
LPCLLSPAEQSLMDFVRDVPHLHVRHACIIHALDGSDARFSLILAANLTELRRARRRSALGSAARSALTYRGGVGRANDPADGGKAGGGGCVGEVVDAFGPHPREWEASPTPIRAPTSARLATRTAHGHAERLTPTPVSVKLTGWRAALGGGYWVRAWWASRAP